MITSDSFHFSFQNAVKGVHVIMSDIFKPPKGSKDKNAIFPKSLRFIVVRHPFSR